MRNKTLIKFATGAIDSPTIGGSLAGNDSKLKLASVANSPRRLAEANKSISLGSEEGLEARRIKNGKKAKKFQ